MHTNLMKLLLEDCDCGHEIKSGNFICIFCLFLSLCDLFNKSFDAQLKAAVTTIMYV